MFIVQNYLLAVILCFVTMLCWGSWANTQKLAGKTWRYELFYWDYVIGILLFSIVLGLTLGSTGEMGRGFLTDLGQITPGNYVSALIGGAIFNLANILLSAAISMAGMTVAFPLGVGIALVLGVIVNYIGAPKGDPLTLFLGVALVMVAIIVAIDEAVVATPSTSWRAPSFSRFFGTTISQPGSTAFFENFLALATVPFM